MATTASAGSDPLLEVASDPSRGRYYVARRDIAEAEVLLRVRPDVWAPAWPGDGEAVVSLSKRESAVIVCDAGFSGAAQQALGIIAAGWLLLVRAALLPDEALEAVLRRCDDNATRRAAEQQALLRRVAAKLSSALHAAGETARTTDQLARLIGVVVTNAFGTRGGDGGGGGAEEPAGYGLFVRASLFNHSCAPNVHADLTCGGGGGEIGREDPRWTETGREEWRRRRGWPRVVETVARLVRDGSRSTRGFFSRGQIESR